MVSDQMGTRDYHNIAMEEHSTCSYSDHLGPVLCCTIYRNKYLISGGYDKLVRIWDLTSNDNLLPMHTLHGHEHMVQTVVVSEEGCILSGSWDKTIKLWELKTGKLLRTLSGHKNRIRVIVCIEKSQNYKNSTSLSGGDDGVIIHWDLSDGSIINSIVVHNCFITMLRVTSLFLQCENSFTQNDKNSDSNILRLSCSLGVDNSLKFWDLTSVNPLFQIERHQLYVNLASSIEMDVKDFDLVHHDIHNSPVHFLQIVAALSTGIIVIMKIIVISSFDLSNETSHLQFIISNPGNPIHKEINPVAGCSIIHVQFISTNQNQSEGIQSLSSSRSSMDNLCVLFATDNGWLGCVDLIHDLSFNLQLIVDCVNKTRSPNATLSDWTTQIVKAFHSDEFSWHNVQVQNDPQRDGLPSFVMQLLSLQKSTANDDDKSIHSTFRRTNSYISLPSPSNGAKKRKPPVLVGLANRSALSRLPPSESFSFSTLQPLSAAAAAPFPSAWVLPDIPSNGMSNIPNATNASKKSKTNRLSDAFLQQPPTVLIRSNSKDKKIANRVVIKSFSFATWMEASASTASICIAFGQENGILFSYRQTSWHDFLSTMKRLSVIPQTHPVTSNCTSVQFNQQSSLISQPTHHKAMIPPFFPPPTVGKKMELDAAPLLVDPGEPHPAGRKVEGGGRLPSLLDAHMVIHNQSTLPMTEEEKDLSSLLRRGLPSNDNVMKVVRRRRSNLIRVNTTATTFSSTNHSNEVIEADNRMTPHNFGRDSDKKGFGVDNSNRSSASLLYSEQERKMFFSNRTRFNER